MSDYEHGPLDTYEVTWTSGHIERVQAHQVIWPIDLDFFSQGPKRKHVMLHGEIDGKWKLVLSAPVDEIHAVRLVTTDESIPDGAS